MRFLLLIFISLFILSCEKDKPIQPVSELDYLTVNLQPFYGIDSLYLDSTYLTIEGYKIKFTDIRFFFTNIKNGDSVLNEASLYDFREAGKLLFRSQGSPIDYNNLSALVGVDSSINHIDPSAFPNESVLNISNAGTMHWGWNPGYIFISVEGKVDTLANSSSTFDKNFSFHVGKDSYLGSKNFSALNWQAIQDHEYHLDLKLNMQTFLNSSSYQINLSNEYITHSASGQEILTNKAFSNFIESISQ
tara:strand:+ start:176 stop:916 length:741 start_codon:yes stop_codon:yes gene_type:complete